MKIAVLGAGAWGTALAIGASAPAARNRHTISLWARDPLQVRALRAHSANVRYLPGVAIPASLPIMHWTVDTMVDLSDHDLVVVATPMAALREVLGQLAQLPVPVVWLCKGFETEQDGAPGTGLMAHEIALQCAAKLRVGVLSGPSFALEVARGQPTALVAASRDPQFRADLVRAFHSPSLRVYGSDDVVGVEVGGAVKNVLAIATGLCDGLQLGMNARAALVTRGLTEMTRFGLALGARAETFMGLSGLGDLVLTATGDLSRNRRVGLALAQGQTLAQAVASLGHVAEGVYCARTVVRRAGQLAVEMPICVAVNELLEGRLDAAQAVAALMARGARDEIGPPQAAGQATR
jgi:glycerol-3-phosphate dehydrogenase (NAD(P)+)